MQFRFSVALPFLFTRSNYVARVRLLFNILLGRVVVARQVEG